MIVTDLNYTSDPELRYERVSNISYTRPDEALSIRQIYERYAMGMPLDIIARQGYYEEGLDPLDRPDADLVDFWLAQRDVESELLKDEAAANEAKQAEQQRLFDEAVKAEAARQNSELDRTSANEAEAQRAAK